MSGLPIDEVLHHFDAVKEVSPGKWNARCTLPANHAHRDRSPSLSIGLGTDGRILLHCFAGCYWADVAAAAGLYPEDLSPHYSYARQNGKPQQRSLNLLAEREQEPATDGLLAYVSLDKVRMRSIEWFEKPLWQRSAFHLLAGVKGSGKGTFTALLVAKITCGILGEAKSVVIVSSEDSVEVDIKPRLVAAGADLARCHYVTGSFRLPDDVAKLQRTLVAVGDVGLLIIDPVSNHIGGRRTDKEEEVRAAIAPLNELADEFKILVIGIRHVGKDRTRGALTSILGSTAWVDVPRAVVMIVNDDEDDAVRHVQVVAGNRSATRGGVMFRIEGVMLDELTEEVTHAVELGASAKDIDDLLLPQAKTDSKSRKARVLVLDILERETGGVESDTLDATVAKATGVTAKTVRNLRGELSNAGLIRSWPVTDESGHPERWFVGRTGAPR